MTGPVLEDSRITEGYRCINSSTARTGGTFVYTSGSFLSLFVVGGWVGSLVLFIIGIELIFAYGIFFHPGRFTERAVGGSCVIEGRPIGLGLIVFSTGRSLKIFYLRQSCNLRVQSQRLLGRWIDRKREMVRLVDTEGAIAPVARFRHPGIMDGIITRCVLPVLWIFLRIPYSINAAQRECESKCRGGKKHKGSTDRMVKHSDPNQN